METPAPPARVCAPLHQRVSARVRYAEGTVWGDRKLMPKSSVPDAGCCPPAGATPPWAPWAAVPPLSPECLTSCPQGLREAHDSCELPPSTSEFPVSGFLWESRPGSAPHLLAGLPLCSASRPS